jgi:phage terminase small subunit
VEKLEPPKHLPEDVAQVWLEHLAAGVPRHKLEAPDFEAYAGQVCRLRDAQRRLANEGLVIADPKGNPVPHPALAIERAAQVELRQWGMTFKRSVS